MVCTTANIRHYYEAKSWIEGIVKETHGSNWFEQKVVCDVDYRHERCKVRVKHEVVIESIVVVGGYESQLERRNYCLERPEC